MKESPIRTVEKNAASTDTLVPYESAANGTVQRRNEKKLPPLWRPSFLLCLAAELAEAARRPSTPGPTHMTRENTNCSPDDDGRSASADRAAPTDPGPRVIGGIPGGAQYPAVPEPVDTDIYLQTNLDELPDPDAVRQLWDRDSAGDCRWFQRHRGQKTRMRSVTDAERDALRMPANTSVMVTDTELGPVRIYRARR
jgi:hypothetical protein